MCLCRTRPRKKRVYVPVIVSTPRRPRPTAVLYSCIGTQRKKQLRHNLQQELVCAQVYCVSLQSFGGVIFRECNICVRVARCYRAHVCARMPQPYGTKRASKAARRASKIRSTSHPQPPPATPIDPEKNLLLKIFFLHYSSILRQPSLLPKFVLFYCCTRTSTRGKNASGPLLRYGTSLL